MIQFDPTVGTPTPHASLAHWYHLPLPGTSNDGEWQEVSVNLQDLLDTYFPGVTFVDVNGVECRGDVDYDTFRVGHARTTRVYTLAPSALGGIISIRDLEYDSDHDTDNTDTWYHYDRLGNVMLTTNANGTSNGLRWQDAFGNQLASEVTGAWAAASAADTPAGFITKPFDGDVGLQYNWQRWYDPQLGRFVSASTLAVWYEHAYGYALDNPLAVIDIDGFRPDHCDWWNPIDWASYGARGIGNWGLDAMGWNDNVIGPLHVSGNASNQYCGCDTGGSVSDDMDLMAEAFGIFVITLGCTPFEYTSFGSAPRFAGMGRGQRGVFFNVNSTASAGNARSFYATCRRFGYDAVMTRSNSSPSGWAVDVWVRVGENLARERVHF